MQIDGRAAAADFAEALVDAAFAGNDAEVRTLFESEPTAARQSLAVAAALADADAVDALLDADPSAADRQVGRRAWTPLLYLCCSQYRRRDPGAMAGRLRIARRLLELDADVNAEGLATGFTAPHVTQMFDEYRWHALEGAAGRLASPDLVKLLLEAGADLSAATDVLSQAVHSGHIDVLPGLLAVAPRNWWPVRWALKACVVLDRIDMAQLIVTAIAADDPSRLLPDQALLEAISRERAPEWIDVLLGDEAQSPATGAMRQAAYRAALRCGQHAAAARLLRRGADETGVSVIDRVIAACVTGDRSAVQRLLADSPYAGSALPARDHRMVAWAVRHGRPRAIPLLCEAGLDPNVPDVDGETPVHLAVRAASMDLLNALLECGAAVDARNFDGQTPLQLALAQPDADGRAELLQRLLAAGANPAPESHVTPAAELLFERAADAVAFGNFETLRELLDDQPSLAQARSARPHRATLLHYCGANGTEDPRQRTPSNAPTIAQLLLERGADPNATCRLYGGGATTMGLLLTSVFPRAAGLDGELVRVLARAGAELHTDDLIGAIEYGAPLAVSALVEAGVPIDTLFVAAGIDDVETIARLLARGADINALHARGAGTALHAAAAMGRSNAVNLLLDHGADARVSNAWGSTPAATARHFGHLEVAELIDQRTPRPG